MVLLYVSIAIFLIGVGLTKKGNHKAAALVTLIAAGLSSVALYQFMHRGGDAKVDKGTISRLVRQDVSPMQWIAWSPNGKRLATCSEHGDLHVWTIRDNRVTNNMYVMGVFPFSDNPSGMAWLNNGKQLAKLSEQYGLDVREIPDA